MKLSTEVIKSHQRSVKCPSVPLIALLLQCRVVAAGPVSLVSTGPLFPSIVACLALPIIPVAQWTPTQCPEATMLKLARWLRTVQQNHSVSLPRTFHSYKRTISLASFTCEGCGFWPISKLDRKADTIGVRRNGHHVKLCCLASEKHRIGPKLVSEAISEPLNFKIYLGACPQAPLGYSVLAGALPT